MSCFNNVLTYFDRHIWEALRVVWPQAHFPGQQVNMFESHL